ncbi:MAG: DUF4258 domain-containing protein [Bdellovibrionota bacterium]
MEFEDFPYELSKHAADVIVEREIPLEWVARTVASPAWREADPSDDTLVHALLPIGEFGGRILRVVYNPRTAPWRIVTVHFDRRARRP